MRPVPPKPAIVVTGNEGHMPKRGVWRYDAFYVSETTFVSAEVDYEVIITDKRPESIQAVLHDANVRLIEVWGPDGELLFDCSKENSSLKYQTMVAFICRKAVLDWFWAYHVQKITKMELEDFSR